MRGESTNCCRGEVEAGMRCKSDSIIIKALFLLLLVLHHVLILILILIFDLLLTDN